LKKQIISTRVPGGEKKIYLSSNRVKAWLKNEQNDSIYFDGWLFRNPLGIKTHHHEIKTFFEPRADIKKRAESIMSDLRKKYTHIIGIHIRQGDYKKFKRGAYFITQERYVEVMRQFMEYYGYDYDDTIFYIASDGNIRADLFSDMNIYISREIAPVDLLCLSQTDMIIGSDSSFGDFASYYGNIVHIIVQSTEIDWSYYEDKTGFFENKYCTMVQY